MALEEGLDVQLDKQQASTSAAATEDALYRYKIVLTFIFFQREMAFLFLLMSQLLFAHSSTNKYQTSITRSIKVSRTIYDINDRGRSKYEHEHVGTGVMEYTPDFGT